MCNRTCVSVVCVSELVSECGCADAYAARVRVRACAFAQTCDSISTGTGSKPSPPKPPVGASWLAQGLDAILSPVHVASVRACLPVCRREGVVVVRVLTHGSRKASMPSSLHRAQHARFPRVHLGTCAHACTCASIPGWTATAAPPSYARTHARVCAHTHKRDTHAGRGQAITSRRRRFAARTGPGSGGLPPQNSGPGPPTSFPLFRV